MPHSKKRKNIFTLALFFLRAGSRELAIIRPFSKFFLSVICGEEEDSLPRWTFRTSSAVRRCLLNKQAEEEEGNVSSWKRAGKVCCFKKVEIWRMFWKGNAYCAKRKMSSQNRFVFFSGNTGCFVWNAKGENCLIMSMAKLFLATLLLLVGADLIQISVFF